MIKVDVDQDLFVVRETVLQHILQLIREYLNSPSLVYLVSPEYKIKTISSEETGQQTQHSNGDIHQAPVQISHPDLLPPSTEHSFLIKREEGR